MESKVVVEVLGCGKRIMLARWQKQRRGIDAGTYREIPLRVRSWLTENSGSCKLRRNLRPESTHRRINMKPEPTDQPVVAERPIGPNVKRLIARKMSLDAIPRGGGFADGLTFLSSKENITESAKAASAWVRVAMQVMRGASEPNEWKDADDETIAGYLLEQIAEREKANTK